MPWYLIAIISIPFLFLVGVIYNSIKDQKKLEEQLPKILKERQRRQQLPKDHPDYIYVKPYDDDEEESSSVSQKSSDLQKKKIEGRSKV